MPRFLAGSPEAKEAMANLRAARRKDNAVPDAPEVSGETLMSGASVRPRSKRGYAKRQPGGISKRETASAFFHVFTFVATVLKKDVQFEEKDFTRIGSAFSGLAGKYPMLRGFVAIVSPLVLLGEVFKIVNTIRTAPTKGAKNDDAQGNGSKVVQINRASNS